MTQLSKHEAEITYLIANYNNGKYIGDCINSLYAQTCNDWCCLIADDKSTDDSLTKIYPLLGPKVKLIEYPQNVGYIRTLMRLIDHAETDLVGILDPDDALYPEATGQVLQIYQANPETGFVYTNHHLYNEDMTKNSQIGLSSAVRIGHTSLIDGFVGHLKTFRRSAYAQTAGLDPKILYAEDRDLVYKLEEVTSVAFIDQPLYKHRQVPNSQSIAPEKRILGIQNHRRAFQNALHRRKIKGIQKQIYLLYFYERYSGRRLTPAQLVPLGRRIKQGLMQFW